MLEAEQAVGLLRQLATDRYVPFLAVEAEGSAEGVEHRVGMAPAATERIAQLVEALIPDAALTVSGKREPVAGSWRIVLTTRHRPLQVADPEQVTRALLAALTAANRTERV